VGLFAIQSAFIMGAAQVIAIDHYPRRLELAAEFGAKTLNFHDVKVRATLTEMTGGRGPDSVIDAVGMEAHGYTPTTSWIS
jgi:threonine dehydrogenase-like Zn-dependent dehydrogenase